MSACDVEVGDVAARLENLEPINRVKVGVKAIQLIAIINRYKGYLRNVKYYDDQPTVIQLFRECPDEHFPADKYGSIEID